MLTDWHTREERLATEVGTDLTSLQMNIIFLQTIIPSYDLILVCGQPGLGKHQNALIFQNDGV